MVSTKNLVSYLRSVFSTAPYACCTAVLILLAGGVFEGVGLFMLIPVLNHLGLGSSTGGENVQLDWLNSSMQAVNIEPGLELILGVVFGVLVLKAVVNYLGVHVISRIEAVFVHRLRNKIFQIITSLNWSYLSTRKTSDLSHSITLQCEGAAEGVEFSMQLGAAIVTLVVGLGIALLIAPAVTIAIIFSGLFIFVVMRFFNKRTTFIAITENQKTAELFRHIEGHFTGLKAFKLLSAEPFSRKRFDVISQDLGAAGRRAALNDGQANLFFQIASAALLIALVYFSSTYMNQQAAQTVLLVIIFARIAPRANMVLNYTRALLGVAVEFGKIQNLMKDAEAHLEPDGATEHHLVMKKGMRLKNVSFAHLDRKETFQLQDVNLDIEINSTIGVVGPSGAGKTTLIDLICGLIQPQNGEIFIDDVVLNDRNRMNWRHQIVCISQDDHLIDGSIRENLTLGRPGLSDAAIWRALNTAGVESFMRQLPNGLDAMVGSHGVNLSRGQRQRLCLARGLLLEPEFLILDEALNALPLDDEVDVLKSINEMPSISTLVIVSHRPSSLSFVDQVIRVDGGRVVLG